MAWERIAGTNGQGRGGRRVSYAIRMSQIANGKLSVTISSSTLKRLRWKVGDRVHFLIDANDGVIGIQRTTEIDGRTITDNGGVAGPRKPVHKHGVIKVPLDPEIMKRCVNGKPRELSFSDLLFDESEDIVAIDLFPL